MVHKSLQHQNIFNQLTQKTLDAIMNYSEGNISHDQLLTTIKTINGEYLKKIDNV
jgi:hypothetical protein